MPIDKPHLHEHPHEDPAAHYRGLLRHADLRVTQMRLGLLALLDSSRQPASAQQIFDDLCAVARRQRESRPDRVTVYRTLNTLVETGLAHKVDPGDRVFRFSLTDHARCEGEKHVHEHPHFVCDSCGTVECLEGEKVIVRSALPRSPERPAKKRRVNQQGVVLHGTCEQCTDEPETSV